MPQFVSKIPAIDIAAAIVWGVCALAVLAGFSSGALAYSDQDLAKLLQSNICTGCDLSEADLGGADLGGADLTEANLHGATLIVANLVSFWLS